MKKIKKVLLLGSGALQIGQAGEFDYSGSQAIKALKEEGVAVILINPNIATIQTSKGFADRVYFTPVTPQFVEEVIKREKPDGILLSFGGQTALNCGMQLSKTKVFEKYKVQVLGSPISSVETTEDRQLFAETLKKIGLDIPKSTAVKSPKDAAVAIKKIHFPAIARSGFSLGGQDSKVVFSLNELKETTTKALTKSPQVLIEEYLSGWKEIEYEVVRDRFDNCIAVCNMENIDPMGIHTGESIVVAPSQTLNNHEYHKLREIALKVIRHLQIVGECNIQFAVNPNPKSKSLEYRIIEVNARLSRSSALASKATGYPLAYVAAKLALGKSLIDLKNSVTRKTIACFEPALDYIVVKFPRWDLGKFVKSEMLIGSSMQSVGEVMAIARNFEEAIQKATRMLDLGIDGLTDEKALSLDYKKPTPWRLFSIAKSIKKGLDLKLISKETGIDLFFLAKIKNITDFEKQIETNNFDLIGAKKLGFSDSQIATLSKTTEEKIYQQRESQNITPKVKQIDTLAAEYPAQTNYLYLTYNAQTDDDTNQKQEGDNRQNKKIIILGSGPYRIGSSVEFDWCSVTSAQTAKKLGYSPIIVNCNPETVSTDYDMADKLYFDQLTPETIIEIYKKEKPLGIIISMGGQTPNNIAQTLAQNGVKILGTSIESIDRAEDRNKFSTLCDKLTISQPPWAKLKHVNDAIKFANEIAYPVLVRPSYVLSGAAMNVAFNPQDLKEYLRLASNVSEKYPVVISKFVQNAKEIELDAIADNGKILTYAISEHVENAGVHSGDSTMVLPGQKIYKETESQIIKIGQKLSKELAITGPFNIQFLAQHNNVMVIECNLRASRSLPFVSKVTGVNFVEVATRAILGKGQELISETNHLSHVGVKAPQFSFSRIKGADPVLRVEMTSTGEVAAFGKDVYEAFLKSIIATGVTLPKKSVFVSLAGDENKVKFLESARTLDALGLTIFATEGTTNFLKNHQVQAQMLHKIYEKKSPNVLDYLLTKKIDLVINIIDPYFKKEFDDDYLIRRATVDYGIPLLTNLQTAELFVESMSRKNLKDLAAEPWDFYVKS